MVDINFCSVYGVREARKASEMPSKTSNVLSAMRTDYKDVRNVHYELSSPNVAPLKSNLVQTLFLTFNINDCHKFLTYQVTKYEYIVFYCLINMSL